MKALITGASSGIGKDFAINLSKLGYDLILVARNEKKLKEVSKLCNTNVTIYKADLSNEEECINLFNIHKDIDLLINNAGFGVFGTFDKTNLDDELNMIDLNIKTVHILTKLYLKEMIKKDSGRILNVASIAGFLPGPLMNTYYATKSYVLCLTTSIFEELRHIKSNVKISVVCPGPINTNFNEVAGVKFGVKAMESETVVKYTLKKMFKNKLIIIPGFLNKLVYIGSKIVPKKIILKLVYITQKKKEK